MLLPETLYIVYIEYEAHASGVKDKVLKVKEQIAKKSIFDSAKLMLYKTLMSQQIIGKQ